MNEHTQALIQRFEQINAEAIGVVEGCPDQLWHAHHIGEERSVNVLAHHIAVGHQVIAEWVQAIATGQHVPTLTMESFIEPNAEHARKYAAVTKSEVIAALRQQGAVAVSLVGELTDEQLERGGELLGRQMRGRDVVEHILIGHVQNHLASIREALQTGVHA